MGSMESFYGGRQGASFVIVKKFDGIDIPETEDNRQYRYGWFAVDEILTRKNKEQGKDPVYIVFQDNLIERTTNNYNMYDWRSLEKNGSIKTFSTISLENHNNKTISFDDKYTRIELKNIKAPLEYKEGMKQCFEKGGITASEVNYGEYVIIDTIFGSGEYNNPDNGKVYRRGMNYNGVLGGAEYIGQIIGPQGATPKIEMTTIGMIREREELGYDQGQIRFYKPSDKKKNDSEDVENLGLVPGLYIEDNIEKYNDDITYGWATLRDERNNIIGALIGFKFPFLVPEITSRERSPYYTKEDKNNNKIPSGSHIGDRIDPNNLELIVDNEKELFEEVVFNDNINPHMEGWYFKNTENNYILTEDTYLHNNTTYYKLDTDGNYVIVSNPLSILNPQKKGWYIKNNDNYILTNDTSIQNNVVYYKNIKDLNVTHGDTGHPFYRKWKLEIPYGIKGDSIKELKIIPTEVRPGSPLWTSAIDAENGIETEKFTDSQGASTAIVDLAEEDKFIILNENDTSEEQKYDRNGNLIEDDIDDQIGYSLDSVYPYRNSTAPIRVKYFEDGEEKIYYTQIQYTYKLKLKYVLTKYDEKEYGENYIEELCDYNTIHNIKLDKKNGYLIIQYTADDDAYLNFKMIDNIFINTGFTKASEDDEDWIKDQNGEYVEAEEGTGDQCVHIEYIEGGEKTRESLGRPLNYIMDAVITKFDSRTPQTPQNHLLVLYSDPQRREDEKNHQQTYPSKRFDRIRNDWIDLGYVKGEAGGLHIIDVITLEDDEDFDIVLTNILKDNQPPEKLVMENNRPVYYEDMDPIEDYRGWGYLVEKRRVINGEETYERLLYSYGYEQNKWFVIGGLADGLFKPSQYIIIDGEILDSNNKSRPIKDDYYRLLKNEGIWLITKTIKSAY